MRVLAAIACFLVLSVVPAAAQSATPAQPSDLAERVSAAQQLLAVTISPDRVDQISNAMTPLLLAQFKRQGTTLNADTQAGIEGVMKDELHKVMNGAMDDLARAYADAFTLAELQAILTFYSTAAGKKVLVVGPVLLAKLVPDVQARVHADLPQISAKMAAVLKAPQPAAN